MNFIHCNTPTIERGKNPSKKSDIRQNVPINLDFVKYISVYQYDGSDDYFASFLIHFHTQGDTVDWYFDSQTVRDNRLKEILEHIKSKGI